MDMSWIQRHALLVLLRNETARVKELSPVDVPANLFSYHLDGLVTAGFIEKMSRGVYHLTPSGESFVGSMSTETNSIVKDIKTVIMFYGKKDEKYLLFKWSRQPYLGQITLPHDRVKYGQPLEEALDKAMQDKLGAPMAAQYKTSVMVKIYHDKSLMSHMNALVYAVNVDDIALPFTSRNGELVLGTVADSTLMHGLDTLIDVIEDGGSLAEVILKY